MRTESSKSRLIVLAGLFAISVFGVMQINAGTDESGSELNSSNSFNPPALGGSAHDISWAQAGEMVGAFQSQNASSAYAWTFSRADVLEVLNQGGAAKLRIYGATNEFGEFTPVLVGATSGGVSMDGGYLAGTGADTLNFTIKEKGFPCPPCL